MSILYDTPAYNRRADAPRPPTDPHSLTLENLERTVAALKALEEDAKALLARLAARRDTP